MSSVGEALKTSAILCNGRKECSITSVGEWAVGRLHCHHPSMPSEQICKHFLQIGFSVGCRIVPLAPDMNSLSQLMFQPNANSHQFAIEIVHRSLRQRKFVVALSIRLLTASDLPVLKVLLSFSSQLIVG